MDKPGAFVSLSGLFKTDKDKAEGLSRNKLSFSGNVFSFQRKCSRYFWHGFLFSFLPGK
jgi:hypothetical protein